MKLLTNFVQKLKDRNLSKFMKKTLSFVINPELAFDDQKLSDFVKLQEKWPSDLPFFFQKIKQSIDARKRDIKVVLEVEISDQPFENELENKYSYNDVSDQKTIIIVGSGPAGLFAALRSIELGFKPIVLERGKDVRARRRDIAAINKLQIVDPDSNYCFGEGGAGTYSDGKLYTRSKKRGDIKRILEIFVKHGATEKILYEAHPHIGTNKLPIVVSNLRESILKAGGEIWFETKVVDFLVEKNEIKGVKTANGRLWKGEAVILATGHSARDIFELLHQKNIKIEAKPFALGVRVEHFQEFVDQCQYHTAERGVLPAAAYSLVAQTYHKGIQRGVFSFCMCPGGFIVPSSTDKKELVVNGMSPSRRDSQYANSGVVVSVNENDWEQFKSHGPLAALEFQKSVEQKAFTYIKEKLKLDSDDIQVMPAQKIKDFYQGKISKELNPTSYQPGLLASDFYRILPDGVAQALKQGLVEFSKKMKNYDKGQMIGIESRTSSPVRIPRDRESYEHLEIKRLYPCGEGAGYAGGIVSAAMDGERCVEAFVSQYALKK